MWIGGISRKFSKMISWLFQNPTLWNYEQSWILGVLSFQCNRAYEEYMKEGLIVEDEWVKKEYWQAEREEGCEKERGWRLHCMVKQRHEMKAWDDKSKWPWISIVDYNDSTNHQPLAKPSIDPMPDRILRVHEDEPIVPKFDGWWVLFTWLKRIKIRVQIGKLCSPRVSHLIAHSILSSVPTKNPHTNASICPWNFQDWSC